MTNASSPHHTRRHITGSPVQVGAYSLTPVALVDARFRCGWRRYGAGIAASICVRPVAALVHRGTGASDIIPISDVGGSILRTMLGIGAISVLLYWALALRKGRRD